MKRKMRKKDKEKKMGENEYKMRQEDGLWEGEWEREQKMNK